jgi:hypothetical protein
VSEQEFIAAAWPRNPQDEPVVRRWRTAGRLTLSLLLGYAGLQYYFFDVYLTIEALPRVVLMAALP